MIIGTRIYVSNICFLHYDLYEVQIIKLLCPIVGNGKRRASDCVSH